MLLHCEGAVHMTSTQCCYSKRIAGLANPDQQKLTPSPETASLPLLIPPINTQTPPSVSRHHCTELPPNYSLSFQVCQLLFMSQISKVPYKMMHLIRALWVPHKFLYILLFKTECNPDTLAVLNIFHWWPVWLN